MSFNGSSSRVTVADAAPLHLSTAMTLEAWVKPSGAGSADWQALIYKGVRHLFSGACPIPRRAIAGATIGGGLVLVTRPSALPAQTWTHVAVTYDGATLRLFVNGTQVASQPATGALDVSASPLEIGGSLVDGGPFAGLIDDVRDLQRGADGGADSERHDDAGRECGAPATATAPASLLVSAAPSVVPTRCSDA